MKKAVLIVDDEPFVRMDIADIVSESGFEPYEAANAAEAVAMLEAAPDTFAAVITDIDMPGSRSGAVLANHISHLWPKIRTIVVSGGRKPLSGVLPHGTPFFSKPFSKLDISAAISSSVAG